MEGSSQKARAERIRDPLPESQTSQCDCIGGRRSPAWLVCCRHARAVLVVPNERRWGVYLPGPPVTVRRRCAMWSRQAPSSVARQEPLSSVMTRSSASAHRGRRARSGSSPQALAVSAVVPGSDSSTPHSTAAQIACVLQKPVMSGGSSANSLLSAGRSSRMVTPVSSMISRPPSKRSTRACPL